MNGESAHDIRFGILLGSSHPLGAQYIQRAIAFLDSHPNIHIESTSSLLENPGIGTRHPWQFCNAAAIISTILAPHTLWRVLRSAEQKLGRVRHEKNGARTIDLDIAWWSYGTHRSLDLTIPHPRVAGRAFALALCKEAQENAKHKRKGPSLGKGL